MMGDNRQLILSELKSDIIANYSVRRGQIKTFIRFSNEFKLFGCKESASISSVIGQISNALKHKKGQDALILLQSIIDQCTADVFAQHWEQWIKAVIQIVQTDESSAVSQTACNILNSILFHLKSSEYGHQFATGLLPPILTELMQKLKDKDPVRHVILIQVFTTIAKHFPGPCGPFAGKVESYLIPMFDSANEWLQNLAAECFASLPKCGGGGNMGVKHTEFWSSAASRLLSGLHEVLDQIYATLETGTSWPHRPALNLLRLEEVDVQEPCRTTTLAIRFRGLCMALEYMLSLEFPAVVRLPIMCILEFVDRTLAISSPSLLSKPTSQRIHVSAILPLVHEQALRILQALTLSARRELLPYAEVVNAWLIQMLNWSNSSADNEPGQGRIYESLRCMVYETLTVWMQCLGGACGTEMYATSVIRNAVVDCSPSVDASKFKVSTKLGKVEAALTSSKKLKKSNVSAELEQGVMHRKIDPEDRAVLCNSSLQVLRNLLLYCGHNLTSEHYRVIHDLSRLPVVTFFKRSEAEIPMPYNNAKCRKSVYQLLLTILTTSTSQRLSPDQVIRRGFSIGLNDHSNEVRHCCAEALCMAESVVHPRLPTLGVQTIGDTTAVTVSDAYVDSSTFAFASSGFDSSFAHDAKSLNEAESSFAPSQNSAANPDLGKTAAVLSDCQPPSAVASQQVNAGMVQSLALPATAAAGAIARISGTVSDAGKIADVSPVDSNLPTQFSGALPVTKLLSETTNCTVPPPIDSHCQLKTESTRQGDEQNAARKRKRASGDVESDDHEIAPDDLEAMIQSFNYT